ncbi:MAG: PEP-CTERM sorting domain-containing protein [Phycisphaerae bacterium]|nr:PEP-CTERM sorting domain-containing protein [Phycisphaerae bacterium]
MSPSVFQPPIRNQFRCVILLPDLPAPATLWLLAIGALAILRRKRK